MRNQWFGAGSALLAAAMLAGGTSSVQADPLVAPSYTQDPNHIVPTTGWWWAASEAGRGYSVEVNVNNGKAFIATYIYDNSGNATWYVSTLTGQTTNYSSGGFYGPFTPMSTPYTGPLMAYAGGQALNGPYQPPGSPASQGTVNLTFTSPTQGTITWPAGAPFNGHSTTITRYDETNPANTQPAAPSAGIVPQNGWWWNSAAGGSGFFWEAQGNTAFVAGYFYRPDGTPVWYAAGPAQLSSPSTFAAQTSQYSGGPPVSNPGQGNSPTPTSVGTMTINFSSPTTGTLQIGGGQPIPITRYTF